MTQEDRIERICELKVPIYQVSVPGKGIEADCFQRRQMKHQQRFVIRCQLAKYPGLIDEIEKELNISA
ncbi:MAG: hypothetical protein H0X33_14880 [Taibaiella sp.]|nr:hypothetical protein [Taibaiella sp.]